MTKLRSLLVGKCPFLSMALPSLLNKSGFIVDAIFYDSFLKKSRFISNYEIAVNDENLLEKLSKKNLDDYDFIITCDDNSLKNIANSSLPAAQKLKLLPVKNEENFQHLFSKIGLSQTLLQGNVTTPDFIATHSKSEALEAAKKIGFPLMIKINSSMAGVGVFECNALSDIETLEQSIFDLPVLVQKKIIGTEFDFSALYRDCKLIHFSYSKIEKVVMNKFGPSSVRTYYQLATIDKKLFLEMQQLGKAIGANGFVTISCIESSADKKRYFIEADMRPNAWIGFSKFIGDKLETKISRWFEKKETLSDEFQFQEKYPSKLLLPYFDRMTFWEILFNRYNVWRYLPITDYKILFFLIYIKFLSGFSDLKRSCTKFIRHIPSKIFRLFIKEKADRVRIRNKIKKFFS